MKIIAIILFVLVDSIAFSDAEFTKLEWTDCGSPQVQFFDMAVKPMPIFQPGPIELTFKANLLRGNRGKVRTDINIIRTIAGLALPVRWYFTLKFLLKAKNIYLNTLFKLFGIRYFCWQLRL